MPKYINDWNTSEFEQHIANVVGMAVSVKQAIIAGYGNMNFTYRLYLNDGKTLIIKQSPGFCARFPDIPAPEERILSEYNYYNLTNSDKFLAQYSPELLGLDKDNRILYMSDLGTATDFSYLYEQKIKLSERKCRELVHYLSHLHDLKIDKNSNFENIEMRRLNHEYIFHLPYLDGSSAIDLDKITPGLKKTVVDLLNDPDLKTSAQRLGALYFKNTNTLIHGDFYPMSWIETDNGLFVIDPEFGFLGFPEIDIGVFLAHMLMSGNFTLALKTINSEYGPYNGESAARFCAAEVIRRIIYVSQLPLLNSLDFKASLLRKSARVLKTGDMEIYEKPDCCTV